VNFFYSNLDADVQITWSPFDGNLLIAGGNYRWITMVSEDNDPKTTYQHRVGFFLHDEQRLFESLILTAGVRIDYNTITPLAVSPRVAVVWRFAPNQMLRLAFGQAFRKPCYFETSIHLTGFKGTAAFPELGDFFKDNIGNEHLGNEKTTSLEAGHRASFLDNRLTVESDVFYTQYRNTVSFQFDIETNPMTGLPDLSRSQMMFRNTGREVDSVGGSVSLTYRVKKTLRVNANYTYRHSWYISEPPGGPPPGEGAEGERVSWEPEHLANCSFHYLPKGGFRFGAAVHASSSSDYALPEEGSIFGENILVHNPPIFFISGFVAWRIEIGSGWAEAGVRAFNLLNTGFRDLPAMTRMDGTEQGGELLGRRIFFFLRGSI
jgi:outer membrane receptor for ferrienterochelin and colicin